uniref:Uncharacterized protein n=1 Tax=Podoviridae sp. cthau23 TaxID=2825268 RepID=A0A8S5U731_9CAUD|nr:MAG TPA: hypothetical protein [Podoviridae sp. cthau23]
MLLTRTLYDTRNNLIGHSSYLDTSYLQYKDLSR